MSFFGGGQGGPGAFTRVLYMWPLLIVLFVDDLGLMYVSPPGGMSDDMWRWTLTLFAPAVTYFFLIGLFAFLGTMGFFPKGRIWAFVPLVILQIGFVSHKWYLLGLASTSLGYARWQTLYVALTGKVIGGQVVILATLVTLALVFLESWDRIKTMRFIGPWAQAMEIKIVNLIWGQNFIRSESGTHGTAQFIKMKDLRKLMVPSRNVMGLRLAQGKKIYGWERTKMKNAIPIGEDGGGFLRGPQPLWLSVEDHYLISAGSGAGKTLSLAAPAALFCTSSMVINDPQDEIRPISARYRSEVLGQKIRFIKPADEAAEKRGETHDTHGINPMSNLDPEDENFVSNIGRITRLLFKEPKESENTFWTNNSKRLMGAIMAIEIARYHVEPEEFDQKPNLRTVYQYLSMSPNNIIEYLQHYTKGVPSGYYGKQHTAIVSIGSPLIGEDPKTISNIALSAVEDLMWLGEDKYARVVCSDTIDPREVLEGNMTVYINLSVEDMDGREGLVRLILGTFIETQLRAGTNDTNVLYVVDEMLQLGPMKTLHVRALNMGRKAGIRLMGIIQSSVQFEHIVGKETKAGWLDNSYMQFFSAAADPGTLKEISDILGTATARGYNSRGDGRHNVLGGPASGEADSYGETARPLLLPDEVKKVPLSEWIVSIRAESPARIGKIAHARKNHPLYRHPVLEGLGDENPYFSKKPFPAMPKESVECSIRNTPSEQHLYRPLNPFSYNDAEAAE
jgi:type IV secretion system protein VirD4